MNRKTLVVSSNLDSGSGSLRAALEQTQRNPGAYDIVFEGESRGANTLGTGFFTIRLETPLPNLYRGDIRINVVSPRSVTILPERAGTSQNLTTLQQLIGPNGVASPSLLTVGDVQQLYTTTPAAEKPKIQINGFNFVRNRAQGGNGGAGAGGGLGAGGAITFLEGYLEISNSVFQDLQAQGGAGGVGARGGNGSLNSGAVVLQRNSNGVSGGTGGFSSIPVSRDASGTMAYSATGQQLPVGGVGGTRGAELGFFSFDFSSSRNGSNGGVGRGALLFGYGGGGGGGGGGRGRGLVGVPPFLTPLYGSPGEGGSGGTGNRFGGSGNPGGRGGNPNPLPGTNGTSGSAIGGAIAAVTRRGDANWQVPEQVLVLDGVDFYNVSAGTSDSGNVFGNIVAGPGWEDASRAGNGVFVRDVSFGSGRNNRTVLNPSAPQPGFLGRYSTATPDSTNNPFQSGNSAPRIPTVADTRDTILSGTQQFSDNYIINYETGNSVFGIASDLADPENPFNVIWRTLVPDREQSILDEYYSAVNTTYWDTMLTTERLETLIWDVTKAALGSIGGGKAPGNAPANGGVAGVAGAVGGVFGKGVTNSVVNFARDSLAYFNSLGDRANQRDADLAENAATQDRLLQYLNEASATAQIGQIDVGVERSRVIIEGFELGRDSVVLPAADGRTERLAFSISRSSTGTSALDFRYDSGSSTNLPFLSLELDASSNRIINNRQIPLSQYVNSMLSQSEDGSSFVLGAGLNEPIVLDSTSYTGGPAATTVIVDRRVPLDVRISVETSIGDDAIYGSDGDELIVTHSGNDLIFPAFGVDQVNGGEGVDLVSYVRDERALQFRSAGSGSIEVSPLPGQGNFVNSILTDIEGIHAYGKSQIDLSTINRPQNDVFGVISGSGSQITGSSFDDNIEISFFSDYNASIEAAYRETSVINGGSGFNRLRLNFEEAPDPLAFAFSDQGRTLNITSALSDSSQRVNLIDAQNIDFFDIVLGEDSQKFDLGQAFPSQRLAADGESNLSPNSSPVSIVKIHAGGGNDNLFGNQDDNQLYGDLGNDILDGRDGNDLLVGGGGNDVIRGGRGSDRLRSTSGRDVLTGGEDADGFHFSGTKTDTITDFNLEEGDWIVLDEVEAEVVFREAQSSREERQLKKEGIVNFIYRKSKGYALWRGDGMDSFHKIKFESTVPSSALMGSVFGRQSSPSASSSFMEQPVDSQLPIF